MRNVGSKYFNGRHSYFSLQKTSTSLGLKLVRTQESTWTMYEICLKCTYLWIIRMKILVLLYKHCVSY